MHVHNFCYQVLRGENVIFGLSVHTGIIKEDILVLCEGWMDNLDDTTIPTEATYSINITKSRNNFFLSPHYNRANSFLYVNGMKMH